MRVLKNFVLAALLILIGFGAGVMTQRYLNRNREQQVDSLAFRNALARLHMEIGMMAYEVRRNNFAAAAQLSTRFFDELRSCIGTWVRAPETATLRQILDERDAITADLARADPAVHAKVEGIYARLWEITGASDTSPPPP